MAKLNKTAASIPINMVQVGQLYADRKSWLKRAILNVASSGKFSSDRAIGEYVAEIWNAQKCPVA